MTIPAQEVPPAFEGATSSTAPTAAPAIAQAQWPAQQWYRDFGSDELNTFVDAAVHANLDLESARARVAQADARARQAGAAILPSVDANGTANYLAGHSSQGSGHEFDWAAMLSASYEVDFWGKNRATADSARLLAGASRAEQDAVELTALAGVANGYFQLLALRERLAVAQSNRDVAKQLLDVVQARFNVSMASPIELATQKAAYDTAQIAIADLQQAQFEARTALSLLLGRAPENFEVKGQPLDSLREPSLGAGLPSELLTRRPDIFLAEANLRAGHADVAAARAAMFPTLSLTASGGVQSPAVQAAVLTIGGIGPSLNLGANIVQPIFDHGRLKAQRAEVEAKDRELLSAYRMSILAAFNDVENALSAIQHLNQSREFQVENVAQSEQAFAGAQLRYQAGSVDFLTLLEAQKTLYAARDQFIQYKLARLQALVGLCKALGGGWSQPQGPAVADRSTTRNIGS
ncbi:MAG: efflux transporter outer membrane subunit [Proteobacteria bacterium]|nr:efflux transporter outer membrane subunit [Pseudomonadota bacterium]